MGLLNRFISLLPGEKKRRMEKNPETAADLVIAYLMDFIADGATVARETKEFERTKNLPSDARETACIPVYLALENYIVRSKVPAIKKEISREKLREEIRKNIDVGKLSADFRLIFLKDTEQETLLFNVGIGILSKIIAERLGSEHLRRILSQAASGTIIAASIENSGAINAEKLLAAAERSDHGDIASAFSKIYGVFCEDLTNLLGKNKCETAIERIFRFIQKCYDYDLVSRFVKILPEIKILENDRLSYLSREELTAKIKSATQLEKEKRELAEKLAGELAETKNEIEKQIIQRTADLERERKKLDTIAQNMEMGALLLDHEGKMIFLNKKLKDMLGIEDGAEETALPLLLKKFSDVHIGDYLSDCSMGKGAAIPEAESAGRIFNILFRLPSGVGKGAPFCLIWVRDITEEKLLERARNNFLAIASHEMRTPLTIIRGSADLLLTALLNNEVLEPKEMEKRLQSIESSSVRLLDIVNDFLDLSRIEAGIFTLQKSAFDLGQLIRETMLDLEKTAGDKGLYLKLDGAGPLPPVFTDRDRVRQIMINLLSNAIHYTESGGITAEILRDGQFAKIFVKDTGIGIERAKQQMLFQKFQTVGDVFIHSKEYGSGLGLYIAKSLISAMGGKIWLEKSAPGEGSIFGITLPLAIK